jgi:hypothetical protein
MGWPPCPRGKLENQDILPRGIVNWSGVRLDLSKKVHQQFFFISTSNKKLFLQAIFATYMVLFNKNKLLQNFYIETCNIEL